MKQEKSKIFLVNTESQANDKVGEKLEELDFVKQKINDSKNICKVGNVTWRDIRKQVWAVNVGFLFTINDGMTFAFSNLILDELDPDTGSWFASIVGLSIPVGSLLSGPLMDRYGRKSTNLILAIPCISGWFITSSLNLNSLLWLYFTRCLTGLAMGLATSNIVYASEISHKYYRPMFLALATFHFSIGILFVSILQIFLTWKQVAFSSGVFFCISLVLNIFFTPETPIWLAHFQGDWIGAKKSLKWLNPNPKVFEEEWKELTDDLKHRNEQRLKNKFKITSPTIYKPLCILFILFTLQQATFVYSLIVYAIKILPLVSPQLGSVMKNEAFALLGVFRFAANAFSCIVSLKVGRRPLMFISSLGMAVICLLLVILPYCISDAYKAIQYGAYEWSMILLCFMVIVFGTLGVMTIPWCLMVELFPHEVRSRGSAVMICYSYSLLFVFAKMFPFMLDIFGTNSVFAYIFVVSVLIGLFVFFYIPETLGKSFAEIEKYFQQ